MFVVKLVLLVVLFFVCVVVDFEVCYVCLLRCVFVPAFVFVSVGCTC